MADSKAPNVGTLKMKSGYMLLAVINGSLVLGISGWYFGTWWEESLHHLVPTDASPFRTHTPDNASPSELKSLCSEDILIGATELVSRCEMLPWVGDLIAVPLQGQET